MKTYIYQICGEIAVKFYALFEGIILCGTLLDRSFGCATIKSAKTTRPDPQGHGGF
jgi:hypothetical protein